MHAVSSYAINSHLNPIWVHGSNHGSSSFHWQARTRRFWTIYTWGTKLHRNNVSFSCILCWTHKKHEPRLFSFIHVSYRSISFNITLKRASVWTVYCTIQCTLYSELTDRLKQVKMFCIFVWQCHRYMINESNFSTSMLPTRVRCK